MLYKTDKRGRPRILRSVDECGVFQTLREKLRCKEIWVTGAGRWRNPHDDLPKDFEANRAENYQALRKPGDQRRAERRGELQRRQRLYFLRQGRGIVFQRREEQELSILCLHILQSSLGFINTLMLQDVLARPEWSDVLGNADRRGITPLFRTNMSPYGEQLNLNRRLDLAAARPPSDDEEGNSP